MQRSASARPLQERRRHRDGVDALRQPGEGDVEGGEPEIQTCARTSEGTLHYCSATCMQCAAGEQLVWPAGNNFTYNDWVAHRSTKRYARHLAGLLG